MNSFDLIDGEAVCERVPLRAIADSVGTPVYVYSQAMLEHHARTFKAALEATGPVIMAFAVKSNPNLAVLRVLAREGYGADVVSAGEMARAIAAGMAPSRIIFSGVGKSAMEMTAAMDAGIGQFNIESEAEGYELSALAMARSGAAVATLRVNPDVDAGTHAKISTGKAENKFGVPLHEAAGIYARLAALPGLAMRGVALHIGSQLLTLDPLEAAFTKIGALVADLRAAGHSITHVDLGGGLGVRYRDGDVPQTPAAYAAMVARITRDWGVILMFEPGRVLVANAGVMVTRVIRVKPGVTAPFVVVDAAMNDLARPALYDAWHDFDAVRPTGERMIANIVGPVCESTDTFAMGRDIDVVAPGDLAVFRSAGAYGATMANTYNSRPLVPEVLVNGGRWAVVADRIPAAVIMAAERVPDWLDS